MSNMSFFYDTADEGFQKKFIKSLNKQAIHLLNVFKKEKHGSEKIFTAKAIIISALCFRNLSSKLKIGIKLLIDTLNSDIMEDGMHYLRSPSEQFIFLQSLIDIKTYFGSSKIAIPKELNENINKMASALKFFKIANGELAIFNKFQYVESHQVNEVLKRSNSRLKTPNTLNSSGFQRINWIIVKH